MSKLRFGICGLGCMGRVHFARIRKQPDAELVAVCDQLPARRAGDWNDSLGNMDAVQTGDGRVSMDGIATYATTDELIADPNVDAVLVALPTPFHADVSVAALKAGKHVLCEKPMGYHPADCDRMIAAAEEAKRTLMIGQCIRFWPQYDLIRQKIAAGVIGDVRFATLHRVGCPPVYSAGNWLLDATQSGGALLDLHVHDIDFTHYLLGVPATLYARGCQGESGGLDHIVASYTYADGRYAVIEGGWTFKAPWEFEMGITVHGTLGTISWKSTAGPDVRLYIGTQAPEHLTVTGDAYSNEEAYFIDCVRNGRPVEQCLPRSTRLSIVLAWLERRSAETGRLVEVNERLQHAWTS